MPDVDLPTAYLRIFRPPEACAEVPLDPRPYAIGRSSKSDIQLAHNSVSRHHATIEPSRAGHVIRDHDSTLGIHLNGKRVEQAVLKHGDTIQIADFVLQYRTDAMHQQGIPRGESGKVMTKFNNLPSTMKLRYRTIGFPADQAFAPGDTLSVAEGGILIPVDEPMPDNQILEIELTWPDGRVLKLMGEVLGVEAHLGQPQLCVKLHRIDKTHYIHILERSTRGPWVTPPPDPTVPPMEW